MTPKRPRWLLACLALMAAVAFTLMGSMAPAPARTVQPASDRMLADIQRLDPDCQRLGRCKVNAKMVFASLYVDRISSEFDEPNIYAISGWFSLNWLPSAHPDWQPGELSLGCRSSDCPFGGWRDSTTSMLGDRRIWSSHFDIKTREADSFFAYPFDQHWVKVLIEPTNAASRELVNYIDINNFTVELAPSLTLGKNTNFRINYATVGLQTDQAYRTIQPLEATTAAKPAPLNPGALAPGPIESSDLFPQSDNEIVATSISFHLARRTPAALLMITTPMVLIIFNTILAFHWRENSPASRFGSSGLLTTVSLFFAARVFRPGVDHLVFSDIWFIVVFLMITINNVILVWLFRFYKHRGEVKRAGETLLPAWKTENRLSLISASLALSVILGLYLISLSMLNPPAIPIGFLAGNSNYDDMGASVVKVIEENELLPSSYLIDMPPGDQP